MAARKKDKELNPVDVNEVVDISEMLIKDLNKEFGTRIAYNLATDAAPTIVKRWLSTGCMQLDYAMSNRPDGGAPEGRIIEIAGLPSTGKSHIAFQLARTTQQLGGLVIYIDTENATPVEKLALLGIDVRKRFVYCDTHSTEEVFSIVEKLIEKTRAMKEGGKDFPILVVWDSVAATSPNAELENGYEKETMGLQARVISKGMRKITGVIGHNNVTFLCLNQLRMKMQVANKYEDPYVSPGGNAIPFHSSIRLRLSSGSPIKDKQDNVIGVKVICKVVKNKVAPAFRKFEFNILFGRGTDENDSLFDLLNEYYKKNGAVKIGDAELSCSGDAAWKTFKVVSGDGEVIFEKKFVKANFTTEILNNPEARPLIQPLLDAVLVIDIGSAVADEEMSAASSAEELRESNIDDEI